MWITTTPERFLSLL